MLGKKFNAIFSSLAAGVKDEVDIFKVKVEVMMDYESLKEWDEQVHATMTLFDTPIFKEMKLNYISSYGLEAFYEKKGEEPDMFNPDASNEFSFRKFTFTDITVKIREDIPTFIFSMDVPAVSANIRILGNHFKTPIYFSFDKDAEMEEMKKAEDTKEEGQTEELPGLE